MIAVENQAVVSENAIPKDASDEFTVPESNAFGQSFRDYESTVRLSIVENCYRLNHINQTYDFVKRTREEYAKLNKAEMSIWEAVELLENFVDESDPDLDEPQIQHMLQTAEAIRKDYPNEDWLHLTGLLHGDTLIVGCAFDEATVYYKYLKENPDYNNPAYNTKLGVYSEGCGLENVLLSWGHDDYMYLVLKASGTTLPPAALFIIRYHSLYLMHSDGKYQYLMNDEDRENLKWSQIFSKYDLYSKSKVHVDVEKVKPYYESLIKSTSQKR
ncbi:inositol oxygenase 1 [Quercus suber]|uniref:Inositol oxygenase n=1 Tax=Quercus suber TaxID=58331 RepID=A0AAW0LH32_QUESU